MYVIIVLVPWVFFHLHCHLTHQDICSLLHSLPPEPHGSVQNWPVSLVTSHATRTASLPPLDTPLSDFWFAANLIRGAIKSGMVSQFAYHLSTVYMHKPTDLARECMLGGVLRSTSAASLRKIGGQVRISGQKGISPLPASQSSAIDVGGHDRQPCTCQPTLSDFILLRWLHGSAYLIQACLCHSVFMPHGSLLLRRHDRGVICRAEGFSTKKGSNKVEGAPL